MVRYFSSFFLIVALWFQTVSADCVVLLHGLHLNSLAMVKKVSAKKVWAGGHVGPT